MLHVQPEQRIGVQDIGRTPWVGAAASRLRSRVHLLGMCAQLQVPQTAAQWAPGMLTSQETAAHPALSLLLTCCRYRKPLPPRYQAVLDSLAAQQKEIEAHHERNHKSEASGFAGGHARCLDSWLPDGGGLVWKLAVGRTPPAQGQQRDMLLEAPEMRPSRLLSSSAALRCPTSMVRLAHAACPPLPPCPQAKVAARNKSLEDLVQVGTVAGFLLG